MFRPIRQMAAPGWGEVSRLGLHLVYNIYAGLYKHNKNRNIQCSNNKDTKLVVITLSDLNRFLIYFFTG